MLIQVVRAFPRRLEWSEERYHHVLGLACRLLEGSIGRYEYINGLKCTEGAGIYLFETGDYKIGTTVADVEDNERCDMATFINESTSKAYLFYA